MNGQYMVVGTEEAEIALQFVNLRELSRPDLRKEILLKGRFYEAQMDLDMILRYNFMMETDSGVFVAQASATLYQNYQLSWLSSPEHHVKCQWIHPERHQLKVASLGSEPAGPTYQENSVQPEMAYRVVAQLGASDLALDSFSSGTPAHLQVCEKYWSAQEAPGSASRTDLDPLSESGHSEGGCQDLQGPLQGNVGRPHTVYRGGKYTGFPGVADQHELEQRRPFGWRECLSTYDFTSCFFPNSKSQQKEIFRAK